MKLYMHPVSTMCRPIRLFCAENGIEIEEETVDLMTGAQHEKRYASLNPNRQVPMLEDGDLRLTEGSAILKYLADKYDLPSYPADLKKRAKVNEVMDWFNSNFYRDWGYGLIYPQLFPHLKREDAKVQEAVVAWGKDKSQAWLQVLNDHWIGPSHQYLCGNEISIADYLGSGVVTIGDWIDCDLSAYPNVQRWLANMRKLKNWDEVNQVFSGFAAGNKGKEFVRI